MGFFLLLYLNILQMYYDFLKNIFKVSLKVTIFEGILWVCIGRFNILLGVDVKRHATYIYLPMYIPI
jgi:hypothetical protein